MNIIPSFQNILDIPDIPDYRYLIFGKIGEKWMLGVPGVFQNQEHVMASLFGFPEFLPQSSAKDQPDGFGYWYRIVNVE